MCYIHTCSSSPVHNVLLQADRVCMVCPASLCISGFDLCCVDLDMVVQIDTSEEAAQFVKELEPMDPDCLGLVLDGNGNHVIQRCLQKFAACHTEVGRCHPTVLSACFTHFFFCSVAPDQPCQAACLVATCILTHTQQHKCVHITGY